MGRIRIRALSVGVTALSIVTVSSLIAQTLEGEPTESADRVLAVVDEDPILDSDLSRVILLELIVPVENEGEAEEAAEEEGEGLFRRRVLDGLIDQRLRFREIDRYGFAEVPLEEVEEQFTALTERMGGEESMARKLEELEWDEAGIRQLLARQLMVLIYVEERLGPRLLIGLDAVQAYYDETLVPAGGRSSPPISEVRDQIRQLLREQRLADEIELWTEELRLEAEIEDYLEVQHDELPEGAAEPIG